MQEAVINTVFNEFRDKGKLKVIIGGASDVRSDASRKKKERLKYVCI